MPAQRRFTRSVTIVSSLLALVLGIPAVASAAPPSNDNIGSPTVVSSIPFSDSLSTNEATTEPDEPQGWCVYAPAGTVWYEFTPDTSGILRADTHGSELGFDTFVTVWTLDGNGAMTEVACDDEGSSGTTSEAHFQAVAGTRYLIQVGGYWGETGDLRFNLGRSTKGSISGTVTSSAGGPLERVCVVLWDEDTQEDLDGTQTKPDGTYFLGGVANGAHTIEFYDCDARWDHLDEWWDDETVWHQADDVVVSHAAHVTGIDAELTKIPGPELFVSVSGSGTVTSEPGGIDCGFDCSEYFAWDSVVTLTASPSPGAEFTGWSYCDRTQGNQCQVDMWYAKYVYADFTHVDTEDPDTNLWGGPEGFTSSRSAEFHFYSTDWPEQFECSLDGSGFEPCESPAELDGLGDGTHEFRVRAVDRSGNIDPTPATRRWTVDTTQPDLRVERPKAGIYVNNMPVGETGPIAVVGMVSVEVRATDAESGISRMRFEVNGVEVDPWRISVEGSLYRFAFRAPTPGVYDIRAQATNGAGDARSTAFQLLAFPG